MDGWLDGQTDGWMGGQMDGWVCVCVDGQLSGWQNGWADKIKVIPMVNLLMQVK